MARDTVLHPFFYLFPSLTARAYRPPVPSAESSAPPTPPTCRTPRPAAQALCDDKLLPHVSEYLELLQDEFSACMHTKLMKHVLGKQRESLRIIFTIYAQSDRSEEAKKQLHTMNVTPAHRFEPRHVHLGASRAL